MKLIITAKFESPSIYTRLALMEPTMKDTPGISHLAPCTTTQKMVEKPENHMHERPQQDSSGLANALKTPGTHSDNANEELRKPLIQGGASVQKALNQSTEQLVVAIGAPLPTQRRLDKTTSLRAMRTWFDDIENDKIANAVEQRYHDELGDMRLRTPSPPYALQPAQFEDTNPTRTACWTTICVKSPGY